MTDLTRVVFPVRLRPATVNHSLALTLNLIISLYSSRSYTWLIGLTVVLSKSIGMDIIYSHLKVNVPLRRTKNSFYKKIYGLNDIELNGGFSKSDSFIGKNYAPGINFWSANNNIDILP